MLRVSFLQASEGLVLRTDPARTCRACTLFSQRLCRNTDGRRQLLRYALHSPPFPAGQGRSRRFPEDSLAGWERWQKMRQPGLSQAPADASIVEACANCFSSSLPSPFLPLLSPRSRLPQQAKVPDLCKRASFSQKSSRLQNLSKVMPCICLLPIRRTSAGPLFTFLIPARGAAFRSS